MNFPNMLLTRCLHLFLTVALATAATVGLAAPSRALLDDTHAAVRAVMVLQGQVTGRLMESPEILGTAVGVSQAGEPELIVFVDQEAPRGAAFAQGLPSQMQGIGVKVQLTEKFRALRRPTRGGTSHTKLQTPPIQLGTSGGWRYDLANGYCCGGTLGSLVQVGTTQYIMSNYHVMEADIVSGGNQKVAVTGDYVIQPGLIDVGCSAGSAQNVGTLKKLGSLPGSNVDVGVAQVVPGMVRSDGAIMEIGPISKNTMGASVGLAVKKSGRTTGLTHSQISGLNATISVAYENECAGGSAFTQTFTGQIVIANSGSSFLNSGDSGSLMVEDVSTSYPRAVGLLYAGSSSTAIANPIGQVLQFLSSKLGGTATMVGF